MVTHKRLYDLALEAREKAYCPHSGFAVGAALLTKSGKVILGCNIENAAYGPSVCAERTAIFKAVSDGEMDFEAIAVCGAPQGQEPDSPCPPCGICRQVMSEFCDKDFPIILFDSEEGTKAYTLEELLPLSFSL